ncbi:MAG: hypothetical protein FJ242_00795 [Nitrospira sp.]|nr:hypothetical protein [Nitrospira sp.]
MKKVFFVVLISLLSLTACAGIETSRKSMSEDLGSPEKVDLLRERVNDFWSAFVKEDYEKIYYLYDPFFRTRTPNKHAFMGTLGKIKYHKFEVKDIKVEGNVAKLKVSVVYSIPKTRFKIAEFSQPETPAEFEETWLYIYDNWYKEYYMHAAEAGIVYY